MDLIITLDWGTPHSRGAPLRGLPPSGQTPREIGDMAPFMSLWKPPITGNAVRTRGRRRRRSSNDIWLNVTPCAGVMGINWFHYLRYPRGKLSVMTAFVDWMTDSMPGLPDGLSPVVLEAEPSITVTAAPDEGRIDTMVRQYGGRTFLFAVRISEMVPNTGNSVPISSPGVVFTFSSNIADPDSSANVLYEGRSCAFNGTVVTDSFAPNAVHVYEIGN